MHAKIQVLSQREMSGIGKKSNQPYKMTVCQCVVHGDVPLVGELVLPKDHPVIVPGMFDAEFGVAIGQDKRIGGQLVRLTPVAESKAKASPASA